MDNIEHWDFRVVKFYGEDGDGFYICEVYFDKDGKPINLEGSPTPFGVTLEELDNYITHMREAFKKPVLLWNLEEFVEAPK